MIHSGVQRERARQADPWLIIWCLLFVLVAAVFVKCAPGGYRSARDLTDMDADDAARLRASLGRLHLTPIDFALVQMALNAIVQTIGIGISWLLIRARQRNRFTVYASYVILALGAATYPPGIN